MLPGVRRNITAGETQLLYCKRNAR